MDQVVEYLPSKCKLLNSNLSNNKKYVFVGTLLYIYITYIYYIYYIYISENSQIILSVNNKSSKVKLVILYD
jgi:hypothetical protein